MEKEELLIKKIIEVQEKYSGALKVMDKEFVIWGNFLQILVLIHFKVVNKLGARIINSELDSFAFNVDQLNYTYGHGDIKVTTEQRDYIINILKELNEIPNLK